jgi:hypothetical protein
MKGAGAETMSHAGFFRPILAAALIATAPAVPRASADQNKVIFVTPPVQLQIERDRQQAQQFAGAAHTQRAGHAADLHADQRRKLQLRRRLRRLGAS